MSRIRTCILLCFILFLSTLSAPAKAAPITTTILHCNRLLDVHQGIYPNNVVVLIQNDKIVDLVTGTLLVPGARKIEAPGVCLPGLIDVQVHLTSDPEEGGFGYSELGVSIPRGAIFGAKNARKTLMSGFTTVRNVGADGYADVALRDGINAGDVPGPPFASLRPGADYHRQTWRRQLASLGIPPFWARRRQRTLGGTREST